MHCTAELLCVDPAVIHKIWPHVREMIFSASGRTGLSNPEDTEFELLRGEQLLWLAWDGEKIKAALSTRLANGVCSITACGGKDMKSWVGLFPQLESFARNEGCSLRISGRIGWARVLKKYGFKMKYAILERAD
jgi:hypothetical protein